jgi:mono/diheme cytochrome c family protein/uncharacterized membrane protein
MADWVLFFGRFHLLVVHLPIGILLFVGALELAGMLRARRRLSWLPQIDERHRAFILALAAISAAAAALFGWLLAQDGGYDPTLLAYHRNLGIATACAATVLIVLRRRGWLYGPGLVATLVVLGMTGHAGASLTHGSGYLTEHLPSALRPLAGLAPVAPKRTPPADPAEAIVFADIVQPLLEDRCVGCHGPTKSNGNLRSDTWARLLEGGKHGPVVRPGDSAGSRLVQRIRLPLDAKEHMPPKGKPQLTDTEMMALEWWIDAGAPEHKKLVELDVPPDLAEAFNQRFGAPAPDRSATLAAAAAAAVTTGIVIRPLTPDEPWLMASARTRVARFGDEQLAALVPLAPALRWLDLGETAVTDGGLAALRSMKNLRRLHLDRTTITDAGLAHVAGLTQLESLNLHGTSITDAGLVHLRALKRLRALYLWQTRVTAPAAETLAAELVDTRKVGRWKQQISELQDSIRSERVAIQFGAPSSLQPPADQ